jgi:hypothetical protein
MYREPVQIDKSKASTPKPCLFLNGVEVDGEACQIALIDKSECKEQPMQIVRGRAFNPNRALSLENV